MKITNVETFVLSNRSALVRIDTDAGVCGWGESVLEGHAYPTVAAVQNMSNPLIGADPRPITALWQRIARGGFYRGGSLLSSAVAGIDQALWDIKGKALGAPIHELLGGPTREWMGLYGGVNNDQDVDGQPATTGDVAAAKVAVAKGFGLVKVTPGGSWRFLDSQTRTEQLVADLTALREAIGPDVHLAVDFHGRISAPQAIRLLPLLEPLQLAFVEEPVRPEHQHLLPRVVAASTVPIACGERLYSRAEFDPVLRSGIAIAQPDLSHAGGITECLRIAAAAETFDVALAPHCPLGPVALAACLQLDFAIPNAFVQEQAVGMHYDGDAHDDLELLVDPAPLKPERGRMLRLTGPGLGIEVNDEVVRQRAVPVERWGSLSERAPTWTAPDGSFAEW